jgi:peptide/nickel transport system substrate-binding protein
MKIVDSMPGSAVDLDPATSWTQQTWMIEYATCSKLMNYPDAAGGAGTAVQPEAAQSVSVSPDKLTYTFTVAPDLAFSPPSTDVVTADSFRVAFERLAKLNPTAATFYFSGVAGIQDFIDGTTSSISGVQASGNQLQITLTKPDAGFLHKVAVPFLCAVPASTPLTALSTPPPTAGPYYVDPTTVGDLDGNTTFSLIRNPNYTGSRPATLPQIDFEFGVSDGVTRAQADPATADLVFNVPLSQRTGLDTFYGNGSPADAAGHQQYFVDPILGTRYVVLNTRAGGKLTDPTVRRAISTVLNRNSLAGLSGDQPTDQYLPPNILGFKDADLYAFGGDVAAAQALMESAGFNAGNHLALTLVVPGGTGGITLGNALAPMLEQAYMDITIDSSHGNTGTTGQWLDDNPTGYDLTTLGWIVDYPDPSNMLEPLLSGAELAKPSHVNYARFDDPATNDAFGYAAQLTGDARGTEYEQLDADLAGNAAPLAAYANIVRATFTSSRLGCYVSHAEYGPDLGRLCERTTVTPGGTYDTGGTATAGDPLQAAITTPNGGDVAVTSGSTASDVSGYQLLGNELAIEAPDASAAAPLQLSFTVDAAALAAAGVTTDTVEVLRNGVAISACTANDGTATPDPCISARTTDVDGDAHITVLSSHASTWSFARADSTAPTVASVALAPEAIQPGSTSTVHVASQSDAVGAEFFVGSDAGAGENLPLNGDAGSFDSPGFGATLPEGDYVIGVRVRDAAHNWSAADVTQHLLVDGTAPTNPALASFDHAVSAWSGDNSVHVAFAGAADSLSGVDGFSYEWSASASTVPDTTVDAGGSATDATSAALADGTAHWFNLRTRDRAGNWSGAAHLGPFWIDTAAPTNPALSSSSHTVGIASTDDTVDVHWSGAADAGSGVAGYSYVWSQSATTVPATRANAGAGSTGTTSPALADGSWYLHLRTVDALGHWSSTTAIGPFVIQHATTSPPPPAKKHCVVPKVVGLKLAAAKKKIARAHCRVGKISHKAAPKAKRGRVLKQRPRHGARLAVGTRIKLTVGR